MPSPQTLDPLLQFIRHVWSAQESKMYYSRLVWDMCKGQRVWTMQNLVSFFPFAWESLDQNSDAVLQRLNSLPLQDSGCYFPYFPHSLGGCPQGFKLRVSRECQVSLPCLCSSTCRLFFRTTPLKKKQWTVWIKHFHSGWKLELGRKREQANIKDSVAITGREQRERWGRR